MSTHEPLEVRRVTTDTGGSRIEPPLNPRWTAYEQLQWNAAVVGLDTNRWVAVEVNTPGTLRRSPTYTLYTSGQSSGPHSYRGVLDALDVFRRAVELASRDDTQPSAANPVATETSPTGIGVTLYLTGGHQLLYRCTRAEVDKQLAMFNQGKPGDEWRIATKTAGRSTTRAVRRSDVVAMVVEG